MTGKNRPKRLVKEPGGILLVALGMAEADIEAAVETLYPTASSLTILATHESPATAKADELWVYAPLGLRGFWRLSDAFHGVISMPSISRMAHPIG